MKRPAISSPTSRLRDRPFKTLVNELLTRPIPELTETYPLQAYVAALKKIERTAIDVNADREERIRFLQQSIIAVYYPWRAMVEAMAEDMLAGKTITGRGRRDILAHYRKTAFERNPGLANLVLNYLRNREGPPEQTET